MYMEGRGVYYCRMLTESVSDSVNGVEIHIHAAKGIELRMVSEKCSS